MAKTEFQFRLFLNLIRAFFPRWNFFDKVAYHFALDFKIPDASKWERVSFDLQRRKFELLFNPQGNLFLMQVALLEQFAVDVQNLSTHQSTLDSCEVQGLTTFKLVKELLRMKLKEYQAQVHSVQFKVVACSPSEEIDIYVSDWVSL